MEAKISEQPCLESNPVVIAQLAHIAETLKETHAITLKIMETQRQFAEESARRSEAAQLQIDDLKAKMKRAQAKHKAEHKALDDNVKLLRKCILALVPSRCPNTLYYLFLSVLVISSSLDICVSRGEEEPIYFWSAIAAAALFAFTYTVYVYGV